MSYSCPDPLAPPRLRGEIAFSITRDHGDGGDGGDGGDHARSSSYRPTRPPPAPRVAPIPGAAEVAAEVLLAAAEPVTTWSCGFSEPFTTCATSVVVWSVMPSLICTGSTDLSAFSFHTTAVLICCPEDWVPLPPLRPAPLALIPAFWYRAPIWSAVRSGVKRSAPFGTFTTSVAVATGTVT